MRVILLCILLYIFSDETISLLPSVFLPMRTAVLIYKEFFQQLSLFFKPSFYLQALKSMFGGHILDYLKPFKHSFIIHTALLAHLYINEALNANKILLLFFNYATLCLASNVIKYWLAVECFIVDCIHLDYMRFITKITNVMLIANKIKPPIQLIEFLFVLVVELFVVINDVLVLKTLNLRPNKTSFKTNLFEPTFRPLLAVG